MGRKVISVWLSLVIILSLIVIVDVTMDFTLNVKGTTLYVNTTGSNGAFTKIQDAINASSDGDTVFVYSGTYYERFTVNKSINLTGEDKGTTIIDGGRSRNVVGISADWVNLTDFTITQSGNHMYFAGIMLASASFCRIYNNILHHNCYSISLTGLYGQSNYNVIVGNEIFNNWIGIYLQPDSNFNIIMNNNISSNSAYGISLYKSSDNIISENRISYSDWIGIAISTSINNSVTKNILTDDGIFLWGVECKHYNSHLIPTDNLVNGRPVRYFKDTRNIIIDGNVMDVGQLILANCTNIIARNLNINDTDAGIQMAHSTDLNIVNNKVSSIDRYAVSFEYSSDITFSNNNVSHNSHAIHLYRSSDIVMRNNIVFWNLEGFRFFRCENNSIYHNSIIYNYMQVYDDMPASNDWFHPILLEGNYWSDYMGLDDGSGTGKHAIAGDGIGDTLIPHPRTDFDFYPLMEPPKPKPHVTINIDPDTLNLKSKGRWITCYIELTEGYDVKEIDAITILLGGSLQPILDPKYGFVKSEDSYIMDHDNDTIEERMVKFDRNDVEDMLTPGTYNLKVSGKLNDGTEFEGYSDEVRIINPPGH